MQVFVCMESWIIALAPTWEFCVVSDSLCSKGLSFCVLLFCPVVDGYELRVFFLAVCTQLDWVRLLSN